MFAWLGSIRIGSNAFTAPTQASETAKVSFARHNVAEGKPVLQDMGEDLDGKKLHFFFDEAWCDPEEELGRLRAAQLARSPLPFVTGAGTFTGARYVIESIDQEIKRTTLSGRTVRLDASLTLTESPVQDLTGLATTLQRAAAAGISALSGLNVSVRR
ncbi:MAG: hypothetical protein DI527_16445 [Chelatococcus sp.]|nr:MAG: hypothetical protein DI527_16445 [Chelatococcus sp.]